MKKLVGLGMALALTVCMSVSTVFAVGSATANGTVTGATGINEGEKVTFSSEATFEDVEPEKVAQIESLNSGSELATVLAEEKVELPEGVNIDLADYSLVTRLQDLVVLDANGNKVEGTNVTVTWEVPNLTSGMGDVYVLHYSTVRSVWEVIKPNDVDFSARTVNATFPDLSPVAVIYNPSTTTTTDGTTTTTDKDKTSVKTGDNTNVALYAGLGGLALIVLGLAAYKTRKSN